MASVFNEYTLMGTAVLGAFYLGEYIEGIAVVVFYMVGEWLQGKAVSKARNGIRALLEVRPETVTLVSGENRQTVAPSSVGPGESIEIKPGERVPLDGTLAGGSALFDTSALTGESVPRNIEEGEEVLAGMIAVGRAVKIKVSRPYGQSALARILALVEDASQRKAPAELFIRRVAAVYTPAVTGLAAAIVLLPGLYSLIRPGFTFVFDDWFYRALVFLVISCPCALVISIPLGYFGGIGAASRKGILFKGGNYLDAITGINTVVFDKTGTLTEGIFEVRAVETAGKLSAEELLRVVASAESLSSHPVARAITRQAREKGIPLQMPAEVTETAGCGLETAVGGEAVQVGNARLFARLGIEFPQEVAGIGETLVLCAVNGEYAGYISLADVPKADACAAIEELKRLNIRNIQIFSGDKQEMVSALAGKVGITQAFGDLLPEDKLLRLEALKACPENRIAFVGDGINDTPALASSHVGIAMGGLGSDAAIEAADVVIQTDRPGKVAAAVRIGKLTRRVVWQNISLAMGVKVLVLLFGAGGAVTLWEAILADLGVALLAIFNAAGIQRRTD